MRDYIQIAVTGGPCGGKSTMLPLIAQALREEGFPVLMVPEASSLAIRAGAKFPAKTDDRTKIILPFENALMRMQCDLEDSMHQLASVLRQQNNEPTNRCIILCDRGLLDIVAYVDPEMLEDIFRKNGWNMSALANRYDMVLHLTTCALGAEEFYEINDVRTETIEESQTLDRLVYTTWGIHSNRKIIGNVKVAQENEAETRISFEEKCSMAIALIKAEIQHLNSS